MCPCGSGLAYDECCERYHDGGAAPTAEALMRARYSAFAKGETGFLWETWHPAFRPERADIVSTDDYLGLRILDAKNGGLFDTVGTVEFEAQIRDRNGEWTQHERSLFERDSNRRWIYVKGL